MIIAPFISEKGGVGKTLLAVSIATALSMRGYRTWLIDLDPNATLSRSMGVSNPTGVNGALTYIMGASKSVKVSTAVVEDGVINNIKVVPPGTTAGTNPSNTLSTAVLMSRLSSLIGGIANHRERPNFVLIDTPALSPALNHGLTSSLIGIANLLILVATDEPGGLGWVGRFLEYAATAVLPGRRQEHLVILNKLASIKGGYDLGVRYVVRVLRSPAVEAAWRLGSVPYLIRDNELGQFRRAIDEVVALLERFNAEYTWVVRP